MYCPSCGMQSEASTAYCVECGTDLKTTSPPSPGGGASAVPGGGSGNASPGQATTGGSWDQAAASYGAWSASAHDAAPATAPLTDMTVIDAILLPLQDPEVAPRLGVSVLFALIPLFGHIWLVGYTLRWTRGLMSGESRRLPEWTDLTGMFFEGMWASVIPCVFNAVPITLTAFIAIPKFLSIAASISAGGPVNPVDILLSIMGYFSLGLFLVVLFSLPIPLALCSYARSGDLLGSMSPSTWAPLIARSPLEFAGSWLAIIVATVVGCTAVGLLNVVPFLGTLAGFVLGLALGVVLMLGIQTLFTRYTLQHGGAAGLR